jgi:protein-disulfide isomerase
VRPGVDPTVLTRCAIGLVCLAAVARADDATSRGGGVLAFDPKSVYRAPRGASPTEGPADAPVTIVAWSDYACRYCNRVEGTLDRLARLYPGQIRWVHRALPLDTTDTLAHEAALAAAAQGRFRPMYDRLFAVHGNVDRAAVELIARELGLDMLRFRADLDAGTYRQAIAADLADAAALGVTSTPTFFLNGRPVHGAQPLEVFADLVDQLIPEALHAQAEHPADLYDALIARGKPRADAPPDTATERVDLDPMKIYRVGVGLPGHQLGPDDAPVTIVEFSDFECPFCAKEAPLLMQLRAKYGDLLRVIYRDYPVLFHRDSVVAAEAGAAAAEQGKFWPFHDQVFAHFGHLSRADLESYATAAGLDLPRFRAALDDRRFHDLVIAEGASGEALGITGTPTVFINGQPIAGVRDLALFEKIVDAHLSYGKDMIAHGLARGDIYAVVMAGAIGDERADPAGVPDSTAIHIELRAEERTRAVDAACRRRDGARAAALARTLEGGAKQRAAAVCAGEGIDLP